MHASGAIAPPFHSPSTPKLPAALNMNAVTGDVRGVPSVRGEDSTIKKKTHGVVSLSGTCHTIDS